MSLPGLYTLRELVAAGKALVANIGQIGTETGTDHDLTLHAAARLLFGNQVAAAHLRPGGTFTYLTNEIDSLGREHQRLLLEHFREIRLRRVSLSIPPNVRDAWWADSMIAISAVK